MAHGPAPRGGRPVVVKKRPKPASPAPAKDPRGPGTAGPAFPGAKGAKRPATNMEKLRFLRKQGYDIPKGASLYVLQSALANWSKGKNGRNPSQWNISIARSNAEKKDSTGVVTKLPKPKGGGGGGGGSVDVRGGGGAGPKPSLGGIFGGGSLLDEGLSKQGAGLLDESFADNIAGLQFDGAINTLLERVNQQRNQAGQNQHDIGHWWDDALASQTKSAADIKGINSRAVADTDVANKAILESLGGGANPGAGMVAAGGEANEALLRGLGASDEAFNARMAPLLQSERAGNLSRQAAVDQQAGRDLGLEVANARRDKGMARAEALMGIRQANNQTRDSRIERLMQIRQLNNAMKQQGFNNRLAGAQTDMAAQELGLKGLGVQADLIAASKKTKKPPRGSWAGSTPTERAAAGDAAFNALTDENGALRPEFKGKSGVQRAVMLVNNAYRARGYAPGKNPQVAKAAMSVLGDLGLPVDPRWWGLGKKKR